MSPASTPKENGTQTTEHYSEEFRRRLLRTTLIRVVVLSLLIGALYVFLRSLSDQLVLWPLLLVLVATYLLNAFVWLGIRRGVNVIHLTYPQLIWDVFVITELVYYTGGVDSPLIPLYFLVIYESSIFLGLKGSLVIAGQSSVVYGYLVWSCFKDVIPGILPTGWLSSPSYQMQAIVVNIYLYSSFFFLSAFVSGYLVERLRRKGQELATTSHMLKRIRLDTDNILKNMAGGLLTVDQEGKIVFFNPAAERILGYREAMVSGQSCSEIFNDRIPDLGRKIMETLEKGITHARCEVSVRNGLQMKPIGLTTALVRDEDGQAGGVVINFQDLTEVKRMEQIVRQADRLAAVGELSAGIAHEIRNPLASMSGAVEVLKEETPLAGENEKLMDLIIRESDRLNKIISQFLDFARLKTPSTAQVSLNRVVEDVLTLLENHPMKNENVSIISEVEGLPIFVRFDEDQLKQLFINLMVNGLEAMPEGGELTIGVRSDNGNGPESGHNGYVDVFISDTGPGIDESVRDRMFEPFVSTKKGGTGLGLSIVQRILEYNKGRIEIESSESSQVTFLVSLPKAQL